MLFDLPLDLLVRMAVPNLTARDVARLAIALPSREEFERHVLARAFLTFEGTGAHAPSRLPEESLLHYLARLTGGLNAAPAWFCVLLDSYAEHEVGMCELT